MLWWVKITNHSASPRMGAAPSDSSCSFTLPQVLLGPASISQSFSSAPLFLWLLSFLHPHSAPISQPKESLSSPKAQFELPRKGRAHCGWGWGIACRAREQDSPSQQPLMLRGCFELQGKSQWSRGRQPKEALATCLSAISLHLSVLPPFLCLPCSSLPSCHAVTPPLHPAQATKVGIVEEPGGDCPQEI